MRKLVGIVSAGLLCAVVSGAAVGRAAATAATDDGSCYSHEFTVFNGRGAFEGESSGHASGNGGNVSWSFSVDVTGNMPSKASFADNPGTLDGSMTAAVHVPGVGHTVNFTSHCISDAQRSVDGILVAFEGVVDAPPWSPGSHDATVFMFVGPAVPGVGHPVSHVYFELKHAFTCSRMSGQYEFDFTDNSASGTESGYFEGKGNKNFRGRASLPDGVTPQAHPCADLYYD
jgi:hypothetical protein